MLLPRGLRGRPLQFGAGERELGISDGKRQFGIGWVEAEHRLPRLDRIARGEQNFCHHTVEARCKLALQGSLDPALKYQRLVARTRWRSRQSNGEDQGGFHHGLRSMSPAATNSARTDCTGFGRPTPAVR
ncbi:MAG: hypothetical protein AAGF44_00870 [Pseudomonadota bacterium]